MLYLILAVVILILIGYLIETYLTHKDREWFPAPGQFVKIGAKKVHVQIAGKGDPVVVLDAGAGVHSLIWSIVQLEIAQFTTVISYDRLGYGWSDDPDQFRTNKRMAIELEEVLAQLGIDNFILVGHSFGGLNARYFAKQFPNKLKGMVLVDSPHLNQYTLSFPNVHHIGEHLVILIFKLLKALSFVGLTRLIAKFRWLPKRINDLVEKLPQDIQPILLRQIFSYRSLKTLVHEFSILEKGCKKIGNQSLADLPLIVISRGFDDLVLPWADRRDKHSDEASWEMMQRKISSLSSKGKWLKAEKSGHMIMLEQPERIVEAIRELVEEVRGEKPFR